MQRLYRKRIVLGVGGGIAAYKSAELIRRLLEHGAQVRVVMTRGGAEFITPLTLQALSGHPVDMDLLDPAYEAFYAARNQVEFYPDALAALRRIAARVPVAAVSNGNADLQRIGIGELFAFQLGSREFGAAKPDPGIFHAACERLGVEHAQVLHVGDHAEMDVAGAMRAGLRGCWINREEHSWTHTELQPDLQFDTLTGLADWLDGNASNPQR